MLMSINSWLDDCNVLCMGGGGLEYGLEFQVAQNSAAKLLASLSTWHNVNISCEGTLVAAC